MSGNASVTVYPATINYRHNNVVSVREKKRVAGYARVSTDQDEQLTSYEAQVDYYTGYIQDREDWIFVGVYTDEGISATSTAKREGFKRMIADALAGKIDLIITKSVSRFARNTVDSLITVRQLKEKGIEVFFEKENIYTLDSKGELLITIMSSLAQEESRSISENVTCGRRKRMQDGKISLPYGQFLGYEKGKNGLPQIVENEARIVRLIYAMFLEGSTYGTIAAYLTDHGIPSPSGKETWSVSTVKSILENEKYSGNALLQKGFTVDFLTKKTKKNEGEIPQYFVKDSHPSIISPETYDLVQSEIRSRRASGQRAGAGPFVGRIFCGEYGSVFGCKVWQSNNKYRRTVWQCNAKYERGKRGGPKCQSPHLTDDDIKTAFVAAFNQLLIDKTQYIDAFNEVLPLIADVTGLDREAKKAAEDRARLDELMRESIEDNARTAQDQEAFNKKYDGLYAKCEAARKRLETIAREKQDRIARKERVTRLLNALRGADGLLAEFDETLWRSTVDRVTVHTATEMTITFRDDIEVHVDIGER